MPPITSMAFQTRFYLILLKNLLIYGISDTFKGKIIFLLTAHFMAFQTQYFIPGITPALL